VRGNESLTTAHDAQFVRIEQYPPHETFLLQYADQTVRGGETAVQSLGRQVQRSLSGNGQHPGDGLVAAVEEQRLATVLFTQRRLNGLGVAELPPKEFGQRVKQDTAGDARLPAAAQFAVSVAEQACDGTPCALGAGSIEARR
jgi:hypothetical protein